MTEDAVVYVAPHDIGIDFLEETLLDAFLTIRDALTRDRPAVAVIRESDVLGHGDPADAALATALVGMVRTLATEGTREGWTVNVLSIPDDLPSDALDEWVARLAAPHGMTGGLVRLGDLHLGRVAT
jgi:NAD(P)-dependent dehydrogenase (short-subunit alcohol dehydrogenase family)